MVLRVQAAAAAVGVLVVSVAIGAQTPVTHRFTPERFYNTFSFAHPPALRIRPGDRVATKTIDAAGVDWNGKQAAQGPNPQTGPFYIEGAEPGDAIVVTIERIETNRPTGFSASLLAPYTVDPASIAARAEREPRRVNWIIDKARGTTRVDAADITPAIELSLREMLGCLGTAPARQEAWPRAPRGHSAWRRARWAMRGFNEALRAEVYGSRIGVSLVGFAQVSSSFWEHNPGSWERLPSAAHRLRTLTPEDAAAAIVEAIEKEKRLVLRPRMIYLLRLLNTLLPRGTERQMWR